jgi:2-methylcitrate dehydratase
MMVMESQTKQIADFARNASYKQIPKETIEQLKRHLLDSVGAMIYARTHPTMDKVQQALLALNGRKRFLARNLSADQAAQYYTGLIRFPDFMDNFLAKESTCHPSDNIGALLAASHLGDIKGREFLTAMAVAYQIECRLTEEMPVMIKGFDHTALLAFSVTAALSRVLGLTGNQAIYALGMAGCSFNPLVTSRASYTSEWKGFASSLVNAGCINIAVMAKHDLTGPGLLFEVPEKGYNAIYGMELKHDWTNESFDLIPRCILKSYNAEVHTQSAIQALLELKSQHNPDAIKEIDVTTFLTAYHIVGGGEYGKRTNVYSKEQADHSLPYVLAVAMLDGQVMPEQLLPERIKAADVQALLQKVKVHTSSPLHKPVKIAGLTDRYTAEYPQQVGTKVTITLENGKSISLEKKDYKGFHTDPFTWDDVVAKFTYLADGRIPEKKQAEIIDTVRHLDKRDVSELLKLIV